MDKLIFLIVIFLTGELSAHQGESHGKKRNKKSLLNNMFLMK